MYDRVKTEWSYIAGCISDQLGYQVNLHEPQPISGGCINKAWKVIDQKQNAWFVKMNKPSRISMFEAEHQGLDEIINSQSIRTPKPLCVGRTKQHSFLVMEYLELKGSPNGEEIGAQLADMHQHHQSAFGWHINNTIGSTPQINTFKNDWVNFWKNQRLLFQLDLALNKGFPHHSYNSGIELAESLDYFFIGYQPIPSLLHGDLWSGNCSSDEEENPVIYDPAVYFGDRETDLAMTELFGGFGNRFMDSYHDHFPIDDGYTSRKTLYNLYHILNHFNLFGGGYGTQATNMIESLLSQIR